jgi:hypothetical protein
MERKNYFQYFDPDNQLRPAIKKQSIVSLDDWELAWEILEPINIATTRREVENGGFIQFYFNKTDYYLPSITEGLLFIKDKQMIKLLEAAESLYKKNEKVFARTKTVSGFSKLYDKIPGFSALDNKYYKLRDKTIKRIVDYFRQNPHEFVKLK